MKRKIITCIAFFLFAACILPQAAFASSNSKSYTKTPTYGQGYFDGKKAGYDDGYSDGYKDGEEHMKDQILSDAEQTIRKEVSATKLEAYVMSSLAWVSIIVISVSIYKGGIDFRGFFRRIFYATGKTKSFFAWVLITAVMIGTARVLPEYIQAIYPGAVGINLLLLYILLLAGWFAARAISGDRYNGCIRVNLYLICAIEVFNLSMTVLPMIRNISTKTGIYSTDPNGIAYSDYPFILIATIVSEAAYLAICVYLAKKTGSNEEKQEAKKEETVEKRHDEKQKLRERIEREKRTLKECDDSYLQNKKILSEAYTDEQLQEMVEHGEFTDDAINEYKRNRENLILILGKYQTMRQTMVKNIGELSRQLAELEADD